MSRPLPSPASEVKKHTAAHSLANLFTNSPSERGCENDTTTTTTTTTVVADLLMASAAADDDDDDDDDDDADHRGGVGEEPATKRVKTEEGGGIIIKAEEEVDADADAAGFDVGSMAMAEVKEEEAGRSPAPPLPVTESTPQRVAGASVLASLGGGLGGAALPQLLPNPVDTAMMAADVEIMSDGNNAMMQQHDYLLQNLVHVSLRTSW